MRRRIKTRRLVVLSGTGRVAAMMGRLDTDQGRVFYSFCRNEVVGPRDRCRARLACRHHALPREYIGRTRTSAVVYGAGHRRGELLEVGKLIAALVIRSFSTRLSTGRRDHTLAILCFGLSAPTGLGGGYAVLVRLGLRRGPGFGIIGASGLSIVANSATARRCRAFRESRRRNQ
jgi:hypothetical protein